MQYYIHDIDGHSIYVCNTRKEAAARMKCWKWRVFKITIENTPCPKYNLRYTDTRKWDYSI